MDDEQFLTLLEEADPLGDLPDVEQVTVEEAKRALRQAFDDYEKLVPADRAPGSPVAEQQAATLALLRAALLASLAALRTPQPRARPSPGSRAGDAEPPWPLSLLARRPEPSAAPPPRYQEPPRVQVSTLRENARSAFAAARRLLAAAGPPPPEVVIRPWAADPELVGVLHDLLSAGAADDGELALGYVRDLRNGLRLRHGIEVVTYDGHNDELFKIYPCERPEDAGRTTRPALVAGGERLRRGEAFAALPESGQEGGSGGDGQGRGSSGDGDGDGDGDGEEL